jgi:DNA-binding NarL/FixJ family response regulator
MQTIRILIVDDHPMMREAMRTAIEDEEDLELAGEAANGQQAILRALALKPDVIVMDLYLPGKDGVAASAEILASNPGARILIVTSSQEDEKVVAAIQAGARGYLLKDAPRRQFLQGIREVARGNLFLPPEIAEKLARGVRQDRLQEADRPPNTPLTRREQEVLVYLGEGLSNRAIADALSLSESTVRVHLYNLMGKLGLESRSQAIVYALGQSRVHPKNG